MTYPAGRLAEVSGATVEDAELAIRAANQAGARGLDGYFRKQTAYVRY